MSKHAPRIPSVGNDPREQVQSSPDPPDKIWFRSLDEAVIESDRCIQCGTCVAACPSDSIGIDAAEGKPTLVRMCTGCSSCWDYCPRSGLRYERVPALVAQRHGLEEPNRYAARGADPDAQQVGQDGGVVTALLATLLDRGEIDAALVATDRDGIEQRAGALANDPSTPAETDLVTVESPEDPLYGTAALATSPAAVRAAAGSHYNQVMSLGRLDSLVEQAGLADPDIALVGTPCVVQGASALEYFDHDGVATLALSIALFCTRSFEYDRLAGELTARGVDLAAADRLDVSDGTLRVLDESGDIRFEAPVDAFDTAGLRGCEECADFLGEAADLSVGNVGSDEDETTVVVRTTRGETAIEQAAGALEMRNLPGTEAIKRLDSWNRRRAREAMAREYEPAGSVGISYRAHRGSYDGTDREPKPANPARVHQYEEWC